MKLLSTLVKLCEVGIKLPLLYDPVSTAPSISLSFAYASFCLTFASIAYLHFHPEVIAATGLAMTFWFCSMSFYLLRKLTKAKLGIGGESVELDGDDK